MRTQQAPPAGEAMLRTFATPADANPNGDIFGGWLMSQMDLAGGYFAMYSVQGRVATVGVEAMSFHLPVYVGDRVSCYCELLKAGYTSISVHVETWARRLKTGEDIKVTEGIFTFVAIDEMGHKRPLPSPLHAT